jgi:hypothetical protein
VSDRIPKVAMLDPLTAWIPVPAKRSAQDADLCSCVDQEMQELQVKKEVWLATTLVAASGQPESLRHKVICIAMPGHQTYRGVRRIICRGICVRQARWGV